jgi:hypothetical protein
MHDGHVYHGFIFIVGLLKVIELGIKELGSKIIPCFPTKANSMEEKQIAYIQIIRPTVFS